MTNIDVNQSITFNPSDLKCTCSVKNIASMRISTLTKAPTCMYPPRCSLQSHGAHHARCLCHTRTTPGLPSMPRLSIWYQHSVKIHNIPPSKKPCGWSYMPTGIIYLKGGILIFYSCIYDFFIKPYPQSLQNSTAVK